MTTFTARSIRYINTEEVILSGFEVRSSYFNTKEEAEVALATFPKSLGLKVKPCWTKDGELFSLRSHTSFLARSDNKTNETGIKRTKKQISILRPTFDTTTFSNCANEEQTLAALG